MKSSPRGHLPLSRIGDIADFQTRRLPFPFAKRRAHAAVAELGLNQLRHLGRAAEYLDPAGYAVANHDPETWAHRAIDRGRFPLLGQVARRAATNLAAAELAAYRGAATMDPTDDSPALVEDTEGRVLND